MSAVKSLQAILLIASAASATQGADCGLAPGWEQQGATRVFDAGNLFEYLDGEAEGYLIYGFVRLRNTTCAKGQEAIVIDISEMRDSDAAYGIFAAHRDPGQPVLPIGAGGEIQPRRAIFVKGKYYVEITASVERDSSAILKVYATEMEKYIEGRNAPPEALGWFPKEKLVSVRLVPESVLGLSALKRGYVAEYGEGKAFIVMEDSPEAASIVLSKVKGRFYKTAPAEIAGEAFQVEDRYLGGLCVFRKGRYVAGYANQPTVERAAQLAVALARRLP